MKKKLNLKIIISEVLKICGKRPGCSEEEFRCSIVDKLKEMDKCSNLEINSDTAKTIRYILNKRDYASKKVVKRLLHWENSRELKLMITKNTTISED